MLKLLVTLMALSAACQRASNLAPTADPVAATRETLFVEIVDIAGTNDIIGLEEAPFFVPAESLAYGIQIVNRSDKTISFPPDFGTRLFLFSAAGDGWLEVENMTIVIGTNTAVLEPATTPGPRKLFVVQPTVPDSFRGDLLRIMVVGHVIENGEPTATIAAATLDLPLK